MPEERLEHAPLSKDETIAEIEFIKQQCYAMGANDSEIPELMGLVDRLSRDDITPAEALQRAYEIQNAKQDYH